MIEKMNNHHKILLVEDDLINQIVIGEMLKEAGYEYDLAKNGTTALKLATSQLYSLVLMDVELPDLNGTDVTAKIRAEERSQNHVPIVALTTHTEPVIKEKCLKSGMNGFANKPISPTKLQEIILQYKAEVGTCNEKAVAPSLFDDVVLSKRQAQCIYFIVLGMTAKQIAQKLGISPRTTETYIKTIKNKLGCRRRSDLISKVLSNKEAFFKFMQSMQIEAVI